MTDLEILELAQAEGFSAAMIAPDQIPMDPKFRAYCQENRCGKYNANYSCPPDCGTVEELRQKTLAEEQAIILTTRWEIGGWEDKEGIQQAKTAHNRAVLRLLDRLRDMGCRGFAAGYNGCPLCQPCKRVLNEPCAFPERRISCMSAYCIDVAELARRCGLEFAWEEGWLYLFAMIAFHQGQKLPVSQENSGQC